MAFCRALTWGSNSRNWGKGTTIGRNGPDHDYDHIFVPPMLRPRVESADVDSWTAYYSGTRLIVSDHFPVYALINVAQGAGARRQDRSGN